MALGRATTKGQNPHGYGLITPHRVYKQTPSHCIGGALRSFVVGKLLHNQPVTQVWASAIVTRRKYLPVGDRLLFKLS